MIAFNHNGNRVSVNYANNIDLTNTLTKYSREVATGTSSTVSFQFTFTGRDFVLLNTNATSGTILSVYPSGASTTISTPTTISTDTDYTGRVTITSGTTVTVNSGATMRVIGNVGYDNEAIDFNVNNLKKTDLYFDMGSSRTWTVSMTLNASSNVTIGSLIAGNFTTYGITTALTKKEQELSGEFTFESKISNYDALKNAILEDDSFVVIPSRAKNGIFIAYGKITLNDTNFTANKFIDSEIANTAKAVING